MNELSDEQDFEDLLEYIRHTRGFDFSGYKRSSLLRRVQKRLQTVELDSYSHYLDYLEVHPEEFVHLFNTLLINVTAFFRNQSAWDYIAAEIVPRILLRKEADGPLRIWSACCASGEEAYTLAMVCAEALGVERFREQVKIYATDVDGDALDHARQATYEARAVAGVPAALLERYFERSEDSYVFCKDLRRLVIFGRHDLIQDAPISRVDLLVCRNALMYFNAETQARILARFHFALQDWGYLFLGKAEMLLTHASTFTATDLQRRVFAKVPKTRMPDRLLMMAQNGSEEAAGTLASHLRIREAAFDTSAVAQITVDTNNVLILANERVRSLFNLTAGDLGRSLQDMEISYRPVELRSCIEQVYTERRTVSIRSIQWTNSGGEPLYLDVQVAPLANDGGSLLGVSVSFIDVTRPRRLQEELEHSNQELGMAYEELQSTNEELETTNEELQSTNEELETMNEELQSTNEELHTLNDELRQRTEELNQVNAFLESILTSLRGGVVVGRDLHVQIWNKRAEDLWGLRVEEVRGQHLMGLDIGLPVEQLRQPVRACLSGETSHREVELEAVNRRGRSICCRVTCTPLAGGDGEMRGVILLMEDLSAAP